MPEETIDPDKTKVQLPLRAVLMLLAGCATATGGAVKFGEYLGGRDAGAAEVERRVAKLETRVDGEALVAERIDRRLYRLEIVQGIKVPAADRIPAAK